MQRRFSSSNWLMDPLGTFFALRVSVANDLGTDPGSSSAPHGTHSIVSVHRSVAFVVLNFDVFASVDDHANLDPLLQVVGRFNSQDLFGGRFNLESDLAAPIATRINRAPGAVREAPARKSSHGAWVQITTPAKTFADCFKN